MTLNEALYLLIGLPVFIGCTYLLWVMIRFGIISNIKTKGAKGRLRTPDPEGVASVCGFQPSKELADFYKAAEVVERVEFQLVDIRSTPPKGWFIGGFTPMTPADAREWRKVSKVPGLPIADNCDGGTYYVAESGGVFLSDPRNHKVDLLVAENVKAFIQFMPLDQPAEQTE